MSRFYLSETDIEIAKIQRSRNVQNFRNRVESFSDKVAIAIFFLIGISLMKSLVKQLGK
mgnify:FL=1